SNADWHRTVEAAISARRLGWLATIMLPAPQMQHLALLRTEASLRALRVLNALLDRESSNGGAVPALADLGLPADATTDPFNDEPLHLKRTPEGWLIYSVGPDLTDDGGDLAARKNSQPKDVGLGPPTNFAQKPQSDAAE
ncbi:MAG TPA: hypothetical protein VMF30_12980, partial [Pirellulales bacterium]|nr:hypothetical protein [Pirellulales bacterium]